MPDRLFLGLDAGGTKTECLAVQDGVESVYMGPGANVARLGIVEAARTLEALVRQALETHPDAEIAALCAGVAGAGRVADQDALTQHLSGVVGKDVPVLVVHDGIIALEAALSGSSGIMVIIGTGSVVLGKTTDGQTSRAGGWGHRLGDDGSGYKISVRGLRAVASAYDGGPPTVLTEIVAREYRIHDVDELIHRIYKMAWPFQELAPHVIQAASDGDAVSRHILASEAMKLVRQIVWVAKRDDLIYEKKLAFVGGLSNEAPYQAVLQQAVEELLPDWEIVMPAGRPVTGAIRLARELSKEQSGS